MEVIIAFIPLAITIVLYWWGFRKFKSKHGPEVPGPQGQTPYGVHGLLAFFIFASCYIAPVFALASANNNFVNLEAQYPNLLTLPGYGTYKIWTFIVVIAAIAWQIWVARRLRWILEPSSLKSAKALCLGVPVLFVAADVILGNLTMNVSPNADALASYIGSIVVSMFWVLYFFLSKRCKNTYLSGLTRTATQTVFEDAAPGIATPKGVEVRGDIIQASTHEHGMEITQRLVTLNELKAAGLLTEQEYEFKRSEIVKSI
jgi:hypothetical protein